MYNVLAREFKITLFRYRRETNNRCAGFAQYFTEQQSCLDDGVFRNIQPFGLKMCMHMCNSVPACLSFNYMVDDKLCQLSSSTRQTYHLQTDPSCNYFEKLGNTVCGNSLCSQEEICVKFKNGNSKCILQRCADKLVVDNVEITPANQAVGTAVNLTCLNAAMSPKYQCSSDGVWKQTNTICKGCYPLIVNGIHFTTGFQPLNTVVDTTCMPFRPGYQTYHCGENEVWIMDLDACQGPCNKYLIKDSASDMNTLITFSSVHTQCSDKSRYKINSTDFNNDEKAGAWCADDLDTTSYVQVNFNNERMVMGVATQGRYPVNDYQFVTQYEVSYSQDCYSFYSDGITYQGNTDTTTVVTNLLTNHLTGKCFRIYPTGYSVWRSMRFDFIGCSI